MELTQAYLKECFDYDPETGNLIWKERPRSHFGNKYAFENSRRCVGRVAGTVLPNGYKHIGLGGSQYLAHRVVWFWHKGMFPPHEIDHVDRDPLNNRLENLRACTASQNKRGRRMPNSSGFRGVSRTPQGAWRAGIWIDGRKYNLGVFPVARAAGIAYARAAVDRFGAFAPIEAKELFNEAYP